MRIHVSLRPCSDRRLSHSQLTFSDKCKRRGKVCVRVRTISISHKAKTIRIVSVWIESFMMIARNEMAFRLHIIFKCIETSKKDSYTMSCSRKTDAEMLFTHNNYICIHLSMVLLFCLYGGACSIRWICVQPFSLLLNGLISFIISVWNARIRSPHTSNASMQLLCVGLSQSICCIRAISMDKSLWRWLSIAIMVFRLAEAQSSDKWWHWSCTRWLACATSCNLLHHSLFLCLLFILRVRIHTTSYNVRTIEHLENNFRLMCIQMSTAIVPYH